MERLLMHPSKTIVAVATISHDEEVAVIKQNKETFVLTFAQIKELYEGVNFYNQLAHI